ncbi:Protein of unknown function (DUF2930) [Synechococcus sp. PCC 7502]|uniref:cofactor assembly of complex C subunit B n=1 Tax=Synechococcus sp. PCC 7502 TaxID=1173263 RepID=UPI00029FDCFB|nr:cofactor assembly of complex C subunit B [Synechococcus sp. PCC 7502]AFY75210.1 Protein of unknown function (DUF2930) [Synechococcus sp. PCC 7502]
MLRFLPMAVGILGGLGLIFNRFLTPSLTASQSRSDALAIIESAILILVTLLWQQVQPKIPEAVVLEGEEGLEFDSDLTPSVKAELAWASHTLLTNTTTKVMIVWYKDKVLLKRGIYHRNKEVKLGAIAQRVLKTQKPVYLVKLALYPGRIEFDYLPENTQGLIIQPLGDQGLIILGANAPRSYTKQDENWIDAIANKILFTLGDS